MSKKLAPVFLVDRMLFGLNRWLRFLGIPSIMTDAKKDIITLKDKYSQSIFITSSKKHYQNYVEKFSYLIKTTTIEDQLKELNNKFQIFQRIELLSLCSICNQPVKKLEKNDIKHRIPPKVFETFNEFWECEYCNRIYWKGGHINRLIDKLKRMGIPIENQ